MKIWPRMWQLLKGSPSGVFCRHTEQYVMHGECKKNTSKDILIKQFSYCGGPTVATFESKLSR